MNVRFLQYFGLVCYGLVLLFLLFAMERLQEYDVRSLCVGSTIYIAFVIAYTCAAKDKKIWSFSGTYLLVFIMFHCGLVIAYGINLGLSPDMFSYVNRWFFTEGAKTAVILILIGISAYQFGVASAELFRTRHRTLAFEFDTRVISIIGCTLVAVAFLSWLAMLVLQGGIGLLFGRYSDYLDTTPGGLRGYLYFFIGAGLMVMAASGPSRWRRAGLLFFALFALLAMSLGLRGEVLFPVFSALAVAGLKKIPIPLPKAIVLAVILLAAIALVRQVRQVGVAEFQYSTASASPADGLAEMGSSMRPLVEVLSITAGNELMYGGSYLAPFDRALVYVVPGWRRPPIAEDKRFVAHEMEKYAGSIGYSSLAEAYRNFGRWGIVLFMAILGFAFGRMDNWRPEPVRQLLGGVILFPFMVQIRNSFIFVPVSLFMGLSLVFLIHHVTKFLNKRRARNHGTASHSRPQVCGGWE